MDTWARPQCIGSEDRLEGVNGGGVGKDNCNTFNKDKLNNNNKRIYNSLKVWLGSL